MARYRIEPERIDNAQDWCEAEYPNIDAAAADLRRMFPDRAWHESVAISEVGVGPFGLDATADRAGLFRLGTGKRIV